jgi:hypothetical protein
MTTNLVHRMGPNRGNKRFRDLVESPRAGFSCLGRGDRLVRGEHLALLSGRLRLLSVLATVAVAVGFSAPVSASAASFTWTGAGDHSSWSDAANWGGTAPSGTVETLTLPALANPECTEERPGLRSCARYSTLNDISGLNVNALSIDDGVGYSIGGNAITLGAGGLTSSTSASSFEAFLLLPITLGASQTWSIDGNNTGEGVALEPPANVTGPAAALGVNLSHLGVLSIREQAVETGPITITGANSSDTGSDASENGTVELGDFGEGSLNAEDGNTVHLVDARI